MIAYSDSELMEIVEKKLASIGDCALWAVGGVLDADYEDDCDERENLIDELREHIYDCVPEADIIEMGASKVVFTFNDIPGVVFKVPFFGYEDYEYDAECGIYESAGCVLFKNAKVKGYVSSSCNDYCAVEAFLYKMARQQGIEDMLAEVRYVCEIDGVPIYAAEECHNGYGEYSIANSLGYKQHASAVERLNSVFYAMLTPLKIKQFINEYGIVKTYKFMKFMDDHLRSFDFHCGNFLYGADGKLKCIDYSSYEG